MCKWCGCDGGTRIGGGGSGCGGGRSKGRLIEGLDIWPWTYKARNWLVNVYIYKFMNKNGIGTRKRTKVEGDNELNGNEQGTN